ncbi:MAG: cyclic nucleotide-binding domain-containing protein [Anaerolineales bacterium]|nr:cyclic nucleotide-binding domain-containing protein [Anaerolineales bacterium]
MNIDIKQRALFLNRIHLFNGLREDELEGISIKLEEIHLPANAIIFSRGDKPNGFYLIYKGKVKVARPSAEGEDVLAILSKEDYFGEESLIENRNRSATLTTEEDSILLFMSRQLFDELILKYEKLRPNLVVAINSHKLARANRFKWLGKNEVIYFMARRHVIRLYQALIPPILFSLIPAFLLIWGGITGAVTPVAVAGILLIGILGWVIWLVIDWSNDYYIVTNQRVIWLEKVLFLYDSRQEAPLGTLLSVGVETDFLGRQLNYGNVNVRTFVGNIKFEYVSFPEQAADMVREYWERTKSKGTQAQKDAMKNAIRAKIGMPVIKEPEEPLAPVFDMGNKDPQEKGLFWTALSNRFKLRQEDGGTIIYHKHWIVLLQQTGKALLLLLFILTLFFIQLYRLYLDPNNASFEIIDNSFRPDTILVLLTLFMAIALGWAGWEYWDWSNDIFMVTPEEIMDLDRTPLGKEERRTAQIENILSTEYQRIGILGILFNYGTVFITVGGAKLSFQDVLDPAGVMSDINRRRMVRIAKKAEESANVDRERMATWVAAYHLNRDEFASASTGQTGNTSGTFRVADNEIDGQIEDMIDDLPEDEGSSGISGEG